MWTQPRSWAWMLALLLLFPLPGPIPLAGQNTLVPEGTSRYEPTGHPDRIVLTLTDDPARSQSVSWRTAPSVERARAQITVAGNSPALHLDARTVEGTTAALEAGNGTAHHHSVTFTDLRPNTLYAYRVGGQETWSEWFQFRTAADRFRPFSFLYFGDAQNAVKAHFSRTIRQAALDLPEARLMLQAGDLVNLIDGVHDDEWGEWFEAGGWLHGMIPSVPATGNHEHILGEDAEGNPRRTLSPHWPVQFALPANGPEGMEETVYATTFQGVRFIVLNSMAAVDPNTPELLERQTRWLEALLTRGSARWTVALFHHPVFSVAPGRDNPVLRERWLPLFEEHGVDLVLQGHDHAYGRGSNVAEGARAWDARVGTMYVVSVAGPKMYFASDDARQTLDRIGEDTQLYQTVRVEWDRLVFESRTVTGRLYDAFELHKTDAGPNRLVDLRPDDAERFCGRPDIPGYREDRCWEGTDAVRSGGDGGP